MPLCGISGKRVENTSYVFGYLIVTAINQSINLSSKQGAEGGHIFPKRKKISLLIFVSEEDHLGLQIRRNEQVLRCQGR